MMVWLFAIPMLLWTVAGAIADPAPSVFRACAQVLPEHRAMFLEAADQSTGSTPLRLSTDAAMARLQCRMLRLTAVRINHGGEDSFLDPQHRADALERSYPRPAP